MASNFGRNVAWVAGLSGVERVAALLQTILIARALGITEYGIYGLLFGTIGFTASVTGMQMGLTATVFIARYKESSKAQARRVIQYVNRFALIVSGAFLLVTIPLSSEISAWLLSSDQYELIVSIGCIFVGSSMLSGIQDGIAQGFEDFKAIARIKIISSFCTLLLIYPSSTRYGLEGALLVLLGGLLLKYSLLNVIVSRRQIELDFPREGSGVEFKNLILKFSAPSMLTSLMVGLMTWLGMYLLSRQESGFNGVAIVSVGLQWRGPLLLLAAAIGSVAIPAYSRMSGTNEKMAAENMQRKILGYSAFGAIIVTLGLVAFASPILNMYGSEFLVGRLPFTIIVATTFSQVMVNTYMQKLVGQGEMRRVLYLHLPYFFLSLVGYIVLIPMYQATGFALAMFVSGLIFLLYLAIGVRKLS